MGTMGTKLVVTIEVVEGQLKISCERPQQQGQQRAPPRFWSGAVVPSESPDTGNSAGTVQSSTSSASRTRPRRRRGRRKAQAEEEESGILDGDAVLRALAPAKPLPEAKFDIERELNQLFGATHGSGEPQALGNTGSNRNEGDYASTVGVPVQAEGDRVLIDESVEEGTSLFTGKAASIRNVGGQPDVSNLRIDVGATEPMHVEVASGMVGVDGGDHNSTVGQGRDWLDLRILLKPVCDPRDVVWFDATLPLAEMIGGSRLRCDQCLGYLTFMQRSWSA